MGVKLEKFGPFLNIWCYESTMTCV